MLRTSGTRQMPKPESEPLFSKQQMGNSRTGDSPQQVSSVSTGETSAGRTSLPSYCNFYTECPVEEEEPSWSLFEGEWHQDTRKCTLRMKQEYLDQFENPFDQWDKYKNHTAESESTLQSWPSLKSTHSISKQTPGWTGEYSSMIEYSASPEVSQWTGQYSDPYEYSVSPKMTRLGKWTESDAPGKPDFKWILEYTPE
ncbi:uncharacterized protein FFB20_04751 [Fusarium fujikuroi]|uniref:Uncharacterized protein n=1 Tax=Fusarium fujikuroi TaxID=5127 RepID=A0A2H3S808_FUSFU|nr:uncharacterized protein Y057_3053 [Fusarium fujikuroi]QGI63546.1 hypothetical protein CEK27_007517 [Fusarium fujikuroi]QGI80821.1 hypothetical protein CEK25_007550 [Fusarium fujikuroi]QGI94428.1 hypothetical protein CEK26_007497 [Fusarium fujikuroi]SCN75161.1 uncharacterized protein FFB20_04751 [Fusarium fujikuroi]